MDSTLASSGNPFRVQVCTAAAPQNSQEFGKVGIRPWAFLSSWNQGPDFFLQHGTMLENQGFWHSLVV
jgi:hypothetical protein